MKKINLYYDRKNGMSFPSKYKLYILITISLVSVSGTNFLSICNLVVL